MGVLPKRLNEFHKIHEGEKIVVCGCGTSLVSFLPYKDSFITIGVNDVPRAFNPTYLVVTDHVTRFQGKRRELVLNSKVNAFFTCVKGWHHPKLVYFDLGGRDLKRLDSPNHVDHFLNSPYVASNIAYKMGAKHIGLIGVDFTSGHFYNPKDGAHPLMQMNYLTKINEAYRILKEQLEQRGVSFFNLNPESKLTTLKKISIDEFKNL